MDIELDDGSGGGGNNNNNAAVVSSFPNRADPQAKEKQPFTWLRAAPYIVVMLAGVALFAVGVARICSLPCSGAGADANKPASDDTTGPCVDNLGYVLAILGVVVLAVFPAYAASTDLSCGCCAPWVDQTDD